MNKWLDGMFIARVSLVAQAAITAGLSSLSPPSLTWLLMKKAGIIGTFAVTLFAFIVFVALIDIVVNDVMPERYVLNRTLSYRWLGVAGIGIFYLWLGFSAGVSDPIVPGGWVLVVGYITLGCICFWWAVVAVVTNYRRAIGIDRRSGGDGVYLA